MSRPIDADALKDVIRQHDYPLADRLNSIDNGMFTLGIFQAIDEQPTISPDDVRPVGKWEDAGKQMLINLENAREQYSVLGYPHRTELKRRCSVCRKITLVDASIEYKYCPHCGAKMKGE